MKCEICNKNEAAVTYREVINGKERVMSLCRGCAAIKEKEFSESFFELSAPFKGGLFDGFFAPSAIGAGTSAKKRCNLCGSSFDEIAKKGRVGCGECYSIFARELEPLLRRLHGNALHMGRMPQRFVRQDQKDEEAIIEEKSVEADEEKLLEKELRAAVKREEYEVAASLRDRLRALREKKEEA